MAVVAASRFDIVLVALDPTVGSEIQKTRPSLVISPDEMNAALRTATVAPLTTQGRPFSWRVPVHFDGRDGLILLDQVRAVSDQRLLTNLGRLDAPTATRVLAVLAEMFAP